VRGNVVDTWKWRLRDTLDYAIYREIEGVIGDSNAWVDERGQEYVNRLVSPRMHVYTCDPISRTTRWNHVTVLRNENLLGTKIQCRSRRTFFRNRSEAAAENVLSHERQSMKGLTGTNLCKEIWVLWIWRNFRFEGNRKYLSKTLYYNVWDKKVILCIIYYKDIYHT